MYALQAKSRIAGFMTLPFTPLLYPYYPDPAILNNFFGDHPQRYEN
jgi:hypothetical protein